MAKAKPTATQLLAYIRQGKDGWFWADDKLYFRLRGNSKTWVFRTKIPLGAQWAKLSERGKLIEIGLGPYREDNSGFTMAEARGLADEFRREMKKGRDPRQLGKVENEGGKTFTAYAQSYLADADKKFSNAKHRQQWHNTLAQYVYPKLGNMLASEITRADVEMTLKPLWDAGKYETFSRVRMRIEKVLNAAFHALDIDRANPARWEGNLKISFGDVSPREMIRKRAIKEGKPAHHAAAPWREVPAIMAKLRAKPEVNSALALRFSILTAARSMEVRALPWAEIDLEQAVWTLPANRSKNGNAHKVPLNAEAMEILKAVKARQPEGCKQVFPGARGGLLSDVAINKQLKAAYSGVTAHGTARSSFRDWVAETTSFPGEVAEAALNHTISNATEAAYRRGDLFNKRIELMKSWGNFLNKHNDKVKLKEAV